MQSAAITLRQCSRMASQQFEFAPKKRVEDAMIYLAHVEAELPLRDVASACGRPLTTVHRAVRRVEALRDDPLLDRVFDTLAANARQHLADPTDFSTVSLREPAMPEASIVQQRPAVPPAPRDMTKLDRATLRVLERLAEADAFLLVANGAEKAGVFSRSNQFRRPLSLLPVPQAADFAARDWVRCTSRTGASAKYAITPAGRAFLRRSGAKVAGDASLAQHREMGERAVMGADGAPEVLSVNHAESPITWLARRRGADGKPLLAAVEVEAAERLRDDFERAQMGPRVTQDWRAFLSPRDGHGPGNGPCDGPTDARNRVTRALTDLGPGLADVALRVCCFLEGLESVETRMGWSARSGKVVLKIALQRLAEHYGLVPVARA